MRRKHRIINLLALNWNHVNSTESNKHISTCNTLQLTKQGTKPHFEYSPSTLCTQQILTSSRARCTRVAHQWKLRNVFFWLSSASTWCPPPKPNFQHQSTAFKMQKQITAVLLVCNIIWGITLFLTLHLSNRGHLRSPPRSSSSTHPLHYPQKKPCGTCTAELTTIILYTLVPAATLEYILYLHIHNHESSSPKKVDRI